MAAATVADSRPIEDIMRDMAEEFEAMQRSQAGYTCLLTALNTVTGQLSPGERRRGLPIFKYTGTSNGVNVIEICSDLQDIDVTHIPGVLAPLINAHYNKMCDAAMSVQALANELISLLPTPQPPASPAAAATQPPPAAANRAA